MFKFFNKKRDNRKSGLSESENKFITTIIHALSFKYPIFKKQLDLETFVYVAPNKIGGDYSFVFGLDDYAWKKICNPLASNYDIKNIHFKDKASNDITVDLYISEDLIIGYTLPVNITNVDLATIDVSKIWEKHFLNEDYSEIEHIIGILNNEQLRKLDMVKNTFKIEINESTYYPVQDIGDGNYLAIDKTGKIFKITHDPFEVKKIFDTVFELLERT